MSTACLEIAAVRPVVSPRHPGGSRTRILLSSVFGPYAQDDDYGSRAMNPMELYHNQVTRTQGPFSLRMFHRSWGLMLIQANVQAPCTVLDFPTLDRFVEELRRHTYDIVGISSIVSNQLKVRKMCELVRRYQPHAKIVVGGHIANMPDLDERIDADYIVRGDGVRWMRQFLGEDTEQPIRHPLIVSGHGCRSAGVSLSSNPEDIAATLIPSVGCPLGCNFCSTSAMFGGKGRFVDFYHTGDELFEVMCQLEQSMGVKAFFAMDENFLFHRRRALRLLELMQQHDKAWALYVFSSANVLRSYSLEQLIGLGISWVWMGIEGENSRYAKLNGIDTLALVRQLQSHGIRILGSTIIGLENHTPENIDQVIAHAVRHDTDFHQFMLYTPLPGTPLHAELSEQGLMKDEDEYHVGDIHGQRIMNYRHPHLSDEQTAEYMIRAFDADFAANGPSTVRIARTTLAGWKRHKDHPDPRIRRRFRWEGRELGNAFTALVAASRKYFADHPPALRAKMSSLLAELYQEFGWKSRVYGSLGGRWLLSRIRREENSLADGWTYEPPTFYERNAAVTDNSAAQLCQCTQPAEMLVGASSP
jgi:radical SAM superfamily enzyme YgiQ (UPF0313 family)